MNKWIFIPLLLAACSSAPHSTKPSVEKALREGIDSMRWGVTSDRINSKTRQASIEKSLYKSIPISVQCYSMEKGSIHEILNQKTQTTVYCFKNDHLVIALKMSKGFTGFNVLQPDNIKSIVEHELPNHDRVVTWSLGSGNFSDQINFFSLYYYRTDAGFAMITNTTLLYDNLDKPEKIIYDHALMKNKNIFEKINLEESLETVEMSKNLVNYKRY